MRMQRRFRYSPVRSHALSPVAPELFGLAATDPPGPLELATGVATSARPRDRRRGLPARSTARPASRASSAARPKQRDVGGADLLHPVVRHEVPVPRGVLGGVLEALPRLLLLVAPSDPPPHSCEADSAS